MLLYPGDAPPEIKRDGLHLGRHIGTHVDAPSHFLIQGRDLHDLSLEHFGGDAVVLDLPDLPFIEESDLACLEIPTGVHILLKTRNRELIGLHQFQEDYCYLTATATERL